MKQAYQKDDGTYLIPKETKGLHKERIKIGQYEVFVNPKNRSISVPIKDTKHGKEYLTFELAENPVNELKYLLGKLDIEYKIVSYKEIQEYAAKKLPDFKSDNE